MNTLKPYRKRVLKNQKSLSKVWKRISEEEFFSMISDASDTLEKFGNETKKATKHPETGLFAELQLNQKEYFDIRIGNRLLKKNMSDKGIPVYSANVNVPFGFTDLAYNLDVSTHSLLWGIDGNFEWNLIFENTPFYPTDHCGVLKILDNKIDTEYLLYFLKATKDQHGFDRTHRASLKNISKVVVKIPINSNGDFDLTQQKLLAEKFKIVEQIKNEANDLLEKINSSNVVF